MTDRHNLLDTIANVFVPIHRDGHKFVFAFGVATLILFFLAAPLGWLGVIATAWCAYFFRDPDRVTPQREGLVVSAGDGRVVFAEETVPPGELALSGGPWARISIFLSIFDVHIARSPVSGRIVRNVYVPGAFFNAELDKASEENERRILVIETPEGQRIGLVLIAGLVARRIVTFVEEGDTLQAGDRIGLIRFGSRIDVYMPSQGLALVSPGQRAIGGETVLADLKSGESPRRVRIS
ncbi:phosphatidylserine decarboxylase [Methyloligella halotolerans]|uniref:Phosphatidylserine decarboxylase proenzyme n=1 Tax=Methyloligella halotolerans TaxID=1177755 RepID=A0A1E2RWF0_9HYPH|nr:phosphatidylserine decarboxylase [Methyloligella halotolerans]ODA66541.1 phosphatidylserine decarboxylase [Methyloligella halotolerans]